ncbi:MAG: UvrD-helicase domain-containing protein, partial [Clostridia bacterium]|nr:UvrD-helicase domain-containing protein [Clostridia bacterium]
MPSLREEQKRIIDFDEGNILVSASAGSGKTFVMIERLVRLITEKKAKVSEILAVTYTESAAKDMKEKLRRALTERIRETGDPELIKELKDLDFAEVSTLHSFASRLIRRYFFVAEVLPDFSILDEGAAKELRADCMDRVFKFLYDRNDEGFIRLVKAYSTGRSDGNLKDLVQKLYDFCRVEKDPRGFAESFADIYSDERFDRTLNTLGAYYSEVLKSLIPTVEQALCEFRALSDIKGEEYAAAISDRLYFAAEHPDPYA